MRIAFLKNGASPKQRQRVVMMLGAFGAFFIAHAGLAQDQERKLEHERDRCLRRGSIAASSRDKATEAPCPHYAGACNARYTHSSFQCVNGLGLFVDVYDIDLTAGQTLSVTATSTYLFVELTDTAGNPLAVGDVGTVSSFTYTATAAGRYEIEPVSSYDTTYSLTTACSGGTGGSVNLVPYQPTGWSDKIVVSTAPRTTTDSSSLSPSDTLYVDWAVLNSGPGSVRARYYTELYLDGTLKNSWYQDPPLDGNTYSSVEDYVLGSLAAGAHTIRLKTDSTNTVAETNERDNEYTKTITVTAGTPPPSGRTVILPAAASIVGAAPFFSDVRVFNESRTASLTVTALYRCFIPSPCNAGTSSIQFTLGPRESKAFDDICAATFGSPNTAGGVEFRFDGDERQLVVGSRLFSTAPFNSVGMFVPGLDDSAAAQKTVLTCIRHNPTQSPPPGFRVNVGVFNGNDSAVTVTFRILDRGVTPVGSPVAKTVSAHSGLQVSGIFEAAGASNFVTDNAVIEVSAASPVFSYAAVLDNATTDPIFVVGAPDQ